MLKKVIALELRKHRRSFFSTLLVLGLGLGVTSFGISYFGHWPLREILTAAIFLLACGTPLLSLLFGGLAGASLMREPVRSSEEVLPLRPSNRVIGAYLASLLYFLLVAFTVFFLLLFTKNLRLDDDLLGIPAFLIYLHFLSFALSYWMRQPIVGAGASLFLVAVQALATGLFHFRFHYFYGPVVLVVAASGLFLTLSLLAKAVEMDISYPWWKKALIVLGLITVFIYPLQLVYIAFIVKEIHRKTPRFGDQAGSRNRKIGIVSRS